MTQGAVDPGFPFRAHQAPRPPSRTNNAQASAILRTAPALHLARNGKEELEMKTKEATNQRRANGQRRGRLWPPRREGAQEIKKALGVGVSL